MGADWLSLSGSPTSLPFGVESETASESSYCAPLGNSQEMGALGLRCESSAPWGRRHEQASVATAQPEDQDSRQRARFHIRQIFSFHPLACGLSRCRFEAHSLSLPVTDSPLRHRRLEGHSRS
jgi:hypothetical protein